MRALGASRTSVVPGGVLAGNWARDPLWTRARAVPSLDLNFAGTKTLDPRITFTRASTGTYVGSDGAIKTATTNEARFDHNPTTGESLGLLVEEARTNSIRNNTMVGAVAGTPGTLPTNWSVFTTLTGLTRQIVGIGTEDGITYIDVRLSGTPNIAGSYFLQTETNTSVSASNGQTWTSSYYVKLAAGSLSGISSVKLSTSNRDSGGNVIASGDTTFTPTSAALNTQRVVNTYTNASASTAYELSFLTFALSGAAIDFTLRIGLPQLELGAFATSVIPTTSATATRAADVASITGTNFSSWYNQTEGTVFADAIPRASGFNGGLISFDNGTTDERIQARLNSGLAASLVVSDGAVVQANILSLNTISAGALARGGYVYKADDFAVTLNGTAPVSDTSGTLPTPTQATVGNAVGASYLNGTIKRLTYWPVRLSNTTLQAITTP